MPKASINHFAIYYPYYKDKLNNLIRGFIFAADNLHFLYSLSNLLKALAYTTKPDLVIKKKKPPRTSLHLSSHQSLSLLLSSTLSKIRSTIFRYVAMSEYVPVMSKEQFSSTLIVENCKYFIFIQNLSDVSFDFFCTSQTNKLLLDNNIMSYDICFANTTNKTNINLFSIKCKQVTCNILAPKMYAMVYGFDIQNNIEEDIGS